MKSVHKFNSAIAENWFNLALKMLNISMEVAGKMDNDLVHAGRSDKQADKKAKIFKLSWRLSLYDGEKFENGQSVYEKVKAK